MSIENDDADIKEEFLVRIKCEIHCYCHIAGEWEMNDKIKKKNERKECTAWTMNINDKKSSALKNCIEYIYITVDAKPKNNVSTESNWLKEWKRQIEQ